MSKWALLPLFTFIVGIGASSRSFAAEVYSCPIEAYSAITNQIAQSLDRLERESLKMDGRIILAKKDRRTAEIMDFLAEAVLWTGVGRLTRTVLGAQAIVQRVGLSKAKAAANAVTLGAPLATIGVDAYHSYRSGSHDSEAQNPRVLSRSAMVSLIRGGGTPDKDRELVEKALQSFDREYRLEATQATAKQHRPRITRFYSDNLSNKVTYSSHLERQRSWIESETRFLRDALDILKKNCQIPMLASHPAGASVSFAGAKAAGSAPPHSRQRELLPAHSMVSTLAR